MTDRAETPPLRLLNDYAGAIPAFAACEVTDYDKESNLYTVTRPTADSLPPLQIVFNSATAIPEGGHGHGFISPPAWATYDGDDPDFGDAIGSQEDSFNLLKDNTGFTVGAVDTSEGRCQVCPFNAGGLALTALENGTVETGSGSWGDSYACVREFDPARTGAITFEREWYVNLDKQYTYGQRFALWFYDAVLALYMNGTFSGGPKTLSYPLLAYGLTSPVDFGTLTWATRPLGSYIAIPILLYAGALKDDSPSTPRLTTSGPTLQVFSHPSYYSPYPHAIRFLLGGPATQAAWLSYYNSGNGITIENMYFKREASEGEYAKFYGGNIEDWFDAQ